MPFAESEAKLKWCPLAAGTQQDTGQECIAG